MTFFLVAALAFLGIAAPGLRLWHRPPVEEASDLDQVARLLLVAVSSGMPLATALRAVSGGLAGPIAYQVAEVARVARLTGMSRGLLDAPPDLQPLAVMLARAHVSGASVAKTLQAFLDARRRVAVFDAIGRGRRLGVVLVLPLTLLLLPGFGLVMFGPFIAGHLGEFLGGG
jgi:hypothetical protein